MNITAGAEIKYTTMYTITTAIADIQYLYKFVGNL